MGILFIMLISIVCLAIIINVVSSKHRYFGEDHKEFFQDSIEYKNDSLKEKDSENDKS